MLYISRTGCQWRFMPAEFGPWTRVWSQFRRWSRNGTWELVVAALHEQARLVEGRVEAKPSMVVIDTHLTRSFENTVDSATGWLHLACLSVLLAVVAPA